MKKTLLILFLVCSQLIAQDGEVTLFSGTSAREVTFKPVVSRLRDSDNFWLQSTTRRCPLKNLSPGESDV
jgi:hypothetical protein